MKRSLITLLIIVCLIITGLLLYKQSRINNSPLKKAREAELAGNFQKAYDFYMDALLDASPAMDLPDINKSKVVDASTWKNDLSKYIEWICLPAPLPPQFMTISNAIDKYKDSFSHSENRIVNTTTKSLELTPYITEWNNSFYAPTAPVDSTHSILASGTHFRNVSFLKLSADKGFTYDINLINITSGKRTEFSIYSESTVTVLAYPGKHLIVCQSSVKFSSGEIWQSPKTIIPITIPEKSSMVSGILITKVSREK